MSCFRCLCIGPSTRIDLANTYSVEFIKKMCTVVFLQTPQCNIAVEVWTRQNGVFVPWTVNCTLCKTPETVDNAFIHCWDAVFLENVLKRKSKKEHYINSLTIRFLPVRTLSSVPYDALMFLGSYIIWQS